MSSKQTSLPGAGTKSAGAGVEQERRAGSKDRRQNTLDRRNEERVAEDLLPRRNPDRADRRNAT